MAQPQQVESFEEIAESEQANESPKRQPTPRKLKKKKFSIFEKVLLTFIVVGITFGAFNVIRVYAQINEVTTSIGRIQTNIDTMESNINSLQQEKNELSKADRIKEEAENADLRVIDDNINKITADEADE